MKKQALIKSSLMASLLIAGLNLTTSCESCSRKDTHTETTKYVSDTDTVYVDSSSSDTGNSGTSGRTGYSGGSSGSDKSGSTSGTPATSSGSTSSSATGSKSSGMTEEEITDKIENSSSKAKDANGKPINSGGTSGSGSGTGTGSTGNNSRVSKPEDQKGN